MRSLRLLRLWQGLALLLMLALLVVSLLPPPEVLADTVSDKLMHLLAYLLLGLYLGALCQRRRQAVLFAGLLAFGLLVECLQALTGYRSFEWADLLADGLGACLGLALAATPLGNSLFWLERRLPGAA